VRAGKQTLSLAADGVSTPDWLMERLANLKAPARMEYFLAIPGN
jgi:hypothetical protein